MKQESSPFFPLQWELAVSPESEVANNEIYIYLKVSEMHGL